MLEIACRENRSNKLISFTTDTFHNQVASYTGGSQLEWRYVESGYLPSARIGMRAALVDNMIYVTGGYEYGNELTSILSWDPSTESWQPAGDLAVARHSHAAVAVPSTIIESEC